MSKDSDISELKVEAQKEWEARGREAVPDLVLLTEADIHGTRSEQELGRDTLLTTQAELMKATGESTLSDDSRQHLLLSVSAPRERSRVLIYLSICVSFPGTFSLTFDLYSLHSFSGHPRPSIGK